MKDKKVLIAVATAGSIKTECIRSLFNLFNAPPCTTEFYITSGVYVDSQRNMAAKRALEANYDYVLFIDWDMIFPTNMLERLIRSDKDVVSTNYVIKLEPAIPMAMDFERNRVSKMGEGLEKVYAAPTGTMLIKTDVLRKLGENPFSRFQDEVTKDQFGEDVAFCERCKRAGIDIYIHWDLTKQIGHVGDKTYTWNDVKGGV
jgi:hypothetical protein